MAKMLNAPQRRQRPRRNPRSGNAYVEFALVFVVFITMLAAAFELSWVLFTKATFHHVAREGVRTAITGEVGSSADHASAIKATMLTQAFGMLSTQDLADHVQVRYYDPTCASGISAACQLGGPQPNSVVQVSIRCYEVPAITSFFRARNPSTGAVEPFTINVSAADTIEPFPGTPPAAGDTEADACTAPPT